MGIQLNRPNLGMVQGNLLSGGIGRCGHHHQALHRKGMGIAHSKARIPPMEPPTTACHVLMPSCSAIGNPIGGQGSRPGAALAAPKGIGADHIKAVGIQGAIRPNQPIPPASLGMAGLHQTRCMAVAGEAMQQQNRVAPVGVEFTPALVGQPAMGSDRPEA